MTTFNNDNSVNGLIDTDKSQDNLLWLQLWRDQQTDFHQSQVSPLLAQFWDISAMTKDTRVLVPLCGKSLDMIWLASHGHRVIGVELSPVAVKAFFSENGLKVKKTREGNFTCWQSGAITIWCGDFFALKKHQLGKIDTVFDRAALTALPEAIRDQYVNHLRSLIDINTTVFLLTIEDIDNNDHQSSDAIDDEMTALYAGYFDITLTHTQPVSSNASGRPESGFHTEHKVYQLTQKPR